MKDQTAEARLKELAQAVVTEVGIPTKDSNVGLYQAFMAFGLEEPRRREIDLKVIFDDFGILGWFLAGVLRGRVRKLLERVSQEVDYTIRYHRGEQKRFWDESYFREKLLEAVAWERERARWDAQDGGKRIRDGASRAATKTRNATVEQLRQLLKLAKIRLLEQQLEVAQRAQLSEEVQKLQEALTQAFNEALEEFGDVAAVVEELAEFDVLMASTRKLGKPKQRKS